MDTLILWCTRGSVLDFKILKFRPTSCLVRLFDALTAVLPLAFRLQMLHFDYKTCILITKLAFRLQTVHLKLQTCVLLTIVAPRFTNATFRFTIKQSNFKCQHDLIAKI